MSEYYMSHTGQELDDAINKVQSGYLLPSGTLNITDNGTHNVSQYASANVNVSQGYTKFKSLTFTTTDSSGTINVTGVGFKPRAIAMNINGDTTLAYLITCNFMWDESLSPKCNATSSTASRILGFGSSLGLTVNSDGFTTNSTYASFKSGVTYNIFCWG